MSTNLRDEDTNCSVAIYPREVPSTLELVREKVGLMEAQNVDDAFFVVDLGQIYDKLEQWRRFLPRVRPFYGKF
ncbi:ornithine decarboxylase [Plakobranchus ocellatus]|uniref:Ornithine decarboxylase n=1 Tax=Plakobranchus ocellatus TaxID=259542 RepID=A0AAV3YFY1_9GAST|nr:ornithine decarboxylase [Plakobranchus ocellatus]